MSLKVKYTRPDQTEVTVVVESLGATNKQYYFDLEVNGSCIGTLTVPENIKEVEAPELSYHPIDKESFFVSQEDYNAFANSFFKGIKGK